MNEWYTVDPKNFATSRELDFFLRQFGPEAGRYLMSVPTEWRERVIHSFSPGTLEHKRAIDTIARALKRGVLFNSSSAPNSNDGNPWIELAAECFKSKPSLMEAYIASNAELVEAGLPEAMPVVAYDDLELAPSAQETIKADPIEFARVCERLVNMGHEIIFVDPFLDLSRDDNYAVVSEILRRRAVYRPTAVNFWVRASEIANPKIIEERARDLKDQRDGRGELSVFVRAIEDTRATDRLHGRYLLTVRGAILVDQGFQRLSRNRTTHVSPVASEALGTLQRKFITGVNDLKVIWSLAL